MINALLNGFLSFASQIITIILSPINLALNLLVPDLSNVVTLINQFWTTLSDYGKFVISYTGFTQNTVSIILILFIANFTIPWTVHGFKLIAKWWEVLV